MAGQTPDLANDSTWLQANRWARDAYECIERGHEIEEFLKRHIGPYSWMAEDEDEGICDVCNFDGVRGGCPGHVVEEFVILDDVSDMGDLFPYLVHTDMFVGLDDPDVERALHLLPQSRAKVEEIRRSAENSNPSRLPDPDR